MKFYLILQKEELMMQNVEILHIWQIFLIPSRLQVDQEQLIVTFVF